MMKKSILKNKISLIASFLAAVLMIVSLSATIAYAMTISITITPQASIYNKSDVVVFNYKITTTAASGEGSQLQAQIDCSNGIITGVTCNAGTCAKTNSYTWTILYTADTNNKNFSGTVTVTPAGSGTVTLSINVKAQDLKNPSDAATASKTGTTYIRTDAEEASYNAELKAQQESIAKRQAEEAAKKASEEAKKNASIAESASVEQSIQESIYEESMRQQSIEESISESESLEELTRPTEIGSETFILLEWGEEDEEGKKEHQFWFVSKDANVPLPAEYEVTDLQIREMDVLALNKEGMDRNTYLVYGTSKMSEEPMWMYFHNEEDAYSFFDYKYLNDDSEFVDPSESETESDTEDSSDESEDDSEKDSDAETDDSKTQDGFRVKGDYLIFLLLAVICGGLLMTFIFLMLWPRKKDDEESEKSNESAWIPIDENLLNESKKSHSEKAKASEEPKSETLKSSNANASVVATEMPVTEVKEADANSVKVAATIAEDALALKEINDAQNEAEEVETQEPECNDASVNEKLSAIKATPSDIAAAPKNASTSKPQESVAAQPQESASQKEITSPQSKNQKRKLFDSPKDAFTVDDQFFEFDDLEIGAMQVASTVEADAEEIEESLKSLN